MHRETAVCGLRLAVATEGDEAECAPFLAALEAHAPRAKRGNVNSVNIAGSAEASGGDRLALGLRLFDGMPPNFDRLAVSARGASFAIRGDGILGEIGDRSAQLDVFGGGTLALQAAMRLACALWLSSRNGLLLHGASVEVEGQALAFLGPSGAGKTTLAGRLERRGARVIADEVAAVRVVDGQARVFGHPLPRRLGDGLAPEQGLLLAAIGMLSHAAPGQPAQARRLAPGQAARAILQRVFLPAAQAAIVEGALACAGAIAETVPVFSLALPNDDRAAACALELTDSLVYQ